MPTPEKIPNPDQNPTKDKAPVKEPEKKEPAVLDHEKTATLGRLALLLNY